MDLAFFLAYSISQEKVIAHLGGSLPLWGIGCLGGFSTNKAIFMHNPISPRPVWGLSSVKNQSFLHPHNLVAPRSHNLLVNSSGLPVTGTCCPVGSVSIGILGFPSAEEIPLLLQITWTPETPCIRKTQILLKELNLSSWEPTFPKIISKKPNFVAVWHWSLVINETHLQYDMQFMKFYTKLSCRAFRHE